MAVLVRELRHLFHGRRVLQRGSDGAQRIAPRGNSQVVADQHVADTVVAQGGIQCRYLTAPSQ